MQKLRYRINYRRQSFFENFDEFLASLGKIQGIWKPWKCTRKIFIHKKYQNQTHFDGTAIIFKCNNTVFVAMQNRFFDHFKKCIFLFLTINYYSPIKEPMPTMFAKMYVTRNQH